MIRCIYVALSLLGFVPSVVAQGSLDLEQILNNVRYELPQFRDVQVDLQELAETEVRGLYRGQFVVEGAQSYPVLVTGDHLYFVAIGPIDTSRRSTELALLVAEEERAQAEQAKDRREELDRFATDLPIRGNPDASVTVYEFSDFQCSYCARGFSTIKELLEMRGQEVRFVYLHLPLEMHDWAKPAAIASTCAALQSDDAFWKLHDGYFLNQDAISLENIVERSRSYLADSGINLDRWTECASDMDSDAYRGAVVHVNASIELANSYGLSGTPSFFVNGRFVRGLQSIEEFNELIDEAAAK